MKRFFKIAWRIMADTAGVISTAAILFSLSKIVLRRVIELFQYNIYYALGLLAMLVFSVAFLVFRLRNNLTELRNIWRKQSVEDKMAPKVVNPKPLDLKNYIPNTTLLESVKKLAENEAREWAHDAEITSFNLYIERDGDEVEICIQVYAISKWKDELLTMYYPRMSSDYEKLDRPHFQREKFFYEIQNWDKAMALVYEKFSTKLSNNFHFQVTSNSSGAVSINLSYENGNRTEKERCTFIDDVLKTEEGLQISI